MDQNKKSNIKKYIVKTVLFVAFIGLFIARGIFWLCNKGGAYMSEKTDDAIEALDNYNAKQENTRDPFDKGEANVEENK